MYFDSLHHQMFLSVKPWVSGRHVWIKTKELIYICFVFFVSETEWFLKILWHRNFSDIALVKNNAKIGSRIAIELCKLKKQDSSGPMKSSAASCDPFPRQPNRTNLTRKLHGRSQTKGTKGLGRPVSWFI